MALGVSLTWHWVCHSEHVTLGITLGMTLGKILGIHNSGDDTRHDTGHDTEHDTGHDTGHDTRYDTVHDTRYDTGHDIFLPAFLAHVFAFSCSFDFVIAFMAQSTT